MCPGLITQGEVIRAPRDYIYPAGTIFTLEGIFWSPGVGNSVSMSGLYEQLRSMFGNREGLYRYGRRGPAQRDVLKVISSYHTPVNILSVIEAVGRTLEQKNNNRGCYAGMSILKLP